MKINWETLGLTESERQAMLDNIDLVTEEELEELLQQPHRYCSVCGAIINPVRLSICPDTIVCTQHAQAGYCQPAPVKAMMIYDHKTAGTICYMSEKTFDESKRLSDRVGNQSILRKVSPSKS